MVRIAKKAQKRSISPRRPNLAEEKTGPKKDNLSKGFKPAISAISGEPSKKMFIPKIK